jgi:hypothetical protein
VRILLADVPRRHELVGCGAADREQARVVSRVA